MTGGLSAREEAEAATISVHVVWYVYSAEDAAGEDVAWGVPVAIHRASEAALADAAGRRGPPMADGNATGHYQCDSPCNLLAFVDTLLEGDAEVVRAILDGRAASLSPRVWYSPGYYRQYIGAAPLLADERRRAAALKVWIIYYEDHFHVGPARDSHPVAVCVTEAEAEVEVERRGRLVPGFDGHVVSGPVPLLREGATMSHVGADVVREVIRRVTAGEAGPILVQ